MSIVNKATRIPRLNSLQIIPAFDALPAGQNTWPLDRGFFSQHILTFFQAKTGYNQKVNASDIISIYLDCLTANITIQVIDSLTGTIVANVLPTYNATIPGNIDSAYGDQYITTTAQFSPSSIPLIGGGAGLSDGLYNLYILATYPDDDSPNDNTMFISETFHVRAAGFPKTMLFQYTNNSNDYDIFFLNGICPDHFAFRVEAYIDIDPAFHDNVFESMYYRVQKLQSVPIRTGTLIVGGAHGLPPYFMDKINRAIACDVFTIDNVQWFKDTNSQWEMKKAVDYAMKGGKITLRNDPSISVAEYNNAGEPDVFRSHTDGYSDGYS